jgi:type IV fimbrial biogenesis protein FimT
MTDKRHSGGFTLVEIATVMAIAAIILMIAIPSFRYVTSSNRAAQEVNALLGDMRYARAEAVKEGQQVTICASSDGLNCSGLSDWKNGWIVFSDPNGNHVVDVTNPVTEPILRVQNSFTLAFKSTDTFQATPALKWVVFNREGFAPTGLAGTANVALHDPTNNNNFTRCVEVTILGLVSTVKYGVGGCT